MHFQPADTPRAVGPLPCKGVKHTAPEFQNMLSETLHPSLEKEGKKWTHYINLTNYLKTNIGLYNMCPCTCKNYFERKCSQKSKQKTFANKAGKGGEGGFRLPLTFFTTKTGIFSTPCLKKMPLLEGGGVRHLMAKFLGFVNTIIYWFPALAHSGAWSQWLRITTMHNLASGYMEGYTMSHLDTQHTCLLLIFTPPDLFNLVEVHL